ncbi:MAG: trypsin-like peptidase domain-containing protein [Oscillospiraceae bacterium]|nr:trypsin-like peptidase domain-containing protein [Oscillospiraceae bacterium]
MNDFNEFDREIEITQPAPRKNHTTAKVMALIAAVAVVGGGSGFAGTYLTAKQFNSSVVQQDKEDGGSSGSHSSDDAGNSTVATPTLDELQSGIKAPTSNAAIEYNSDGTYKYTRDLVSAVSDSIVYISVYVNYNGRETLYGAGSGIIISTDGYIITNNHVVEYGDRFIVKVNDTKNGEESKTYDADLIGTDSDTDLAVLKIETDNLNAAVLGDSDALHIGDDCYAIGNPFGLETSVSKGIISGLKRQISTTDHALTSIQTDAAINSGNSGGALFNGYGEVIGVVNEKYVSSYAESLGFAITINDAKSVIDDLIAKGYVSGRAILGITYKFISESYAQRYGIPHGVLVRSIDDSLEVAKSDLRVGDTIIEIDGEPVTEEVSKMLATKNPGDTVTLTVIREGSYRNNTVKIDVVLSEDTGST